MRALDRLCPRGPLLASFWRDDAATPAQLGGRILARLRQPPSAPSPRESFVMHAGFAYRFTRDEIER
ncbi:MAG TPA: hypothetical protein VGL86_14440 [Polyangia bacterium]|jgi:hypothetical protein